MNYRIALVALLLPLGGCVVPPPAPYGYGYPQPGYPGAEYGYPGYAYNDGSPTLLVEGATLPLIFYGGGWGYWDRGHQWHRAPEGIGRNLDERHPGGVGYRPWGGGGDYGRPVGLRPEGFRPEGFRPEGFRPDVARPGGYPNGGNPYGARPAGAAARPASSPPVQRVAAPAARPAPPERHREDDHR